MQKIARIVNLGAMISATGSKNGGQNLIESMLRENNLIRNTLERGEFQGGIGREIRGHF